MSMRKQLYEWNINRQVNGFPLTGPAQGTTFEQIAGIPFSIFTGGIGNNITMPAATTATQFVTIDNVRGSPSYFLSGAAVLAAYNKLAKDIGDINGSVDLLTVSNFGSLTMDNVDGGAGTVYDLPAPTTNSGSGTGTFRFQVATGAGTHIVQTTGTA